MISLPREKEGEGEGERGMVFCSFCGTLNPDGSNFCCACAKPVVKIVAGHGTMSACPQPPQSRGRQGLAPPMQQVPGRLRKALGPCGVRIRECSVCKRPTYRVPPAESSLCLISRMARRCVELA